MDRHILTEENDGQGMRNKIRELNKEVERLQKDRGELVEFVQSIANISMGKIKSDAQKLLDRISC